MPSYPNQSVLTGIDTGEGLGAAVVRATALQHMVVSTMGSKLLLPHFVIAAISECQYSDCDAPQHESAPGVEVEGKDERMRWSKVSDIGPGIGIIVSRKKMKQQ